jgi:hypothetical protein
MTKLLISTGTVLFESLSIHLEIAEEVAQSAHWGSVANVVRLRRN